MTLFFAFLSLDESPLRALFLAIFDENNQVMLSRSTYYMVLALFSSNGIFLEVYVKKVPDAKLHTTQDFYSY